MNETGMYIISLVLNNLYTAHEQHSVHCITLQYVDVTFSHVFSILQAIMINILCSNNNNNTLLYTVTTNPVTGYVIYYQPKRRVVSSDVVFGEKGVQ